MADRTSQLKVNPKEVAEMCSQMEELREQSAINRLQLGKGTPDEFDLLWECIEAHQGIIFYTAKGLSFSYTVRGNEIFFDRKKKSVTKSTVQIAWNRVQSMQGQVAGPKKIGVFGASYLYPIFVYLGYIENDKSRFFHNMEVENEIFFGK